MYQFDLFLFMKKSTVMLWAIFGALLMGCSDEEIANVETSSRNAIGFNVLSNAAETRAIPTTPSNLTSTDFDVFAFTADGTAFMGKVDTDFEHDGVKIVYKDGKWDYDDANDLRYWPSEALDFYAFNPGTVSDDMLTFYMWEASGTVKKIRYTCIDEYGVGTHANYDVMYAMAKDQTKDMNNGVVKFNFKHILSQVVFKAKTQYDNMQVDIDMIKIHNFKFAGAFTKFPSVDGLIFHSDQGWQYQHVYFRQALKDHKIIQSMSRKGNCYDNCIMETFFGRMKNEMFYGHEKEYSSFETFAKAVDGYINYYNNERIQEKTKWMPPTKFREASMCT